MNILIVKMLVDDLDEGVHWEERYKSEFEKYNHINKKR